MTKNIDRIRINMFKTECIVDLLSYVYGAVIRSNMVYLIGKKLLQGSKL